MTKQYASWQKIKDAQTENFVELIDMSGLDSTKDLRFSKWSDVDFSDCDLTGYDFTAARLYKCSFKGAKIANACFDYAELGHQTDTDGVLSLLSEADDWDSYLKNWNPPKTAVPDDHLLKNVFFHDTPFTPNMFTASDDEGMLIGRSEITAEHWNNAVVAGFNGQRIEDDKSLTTIISLAEKGKFAQWLSDWTDMYYQPLFDPKCDKAFYIFRELELVIPYAFYSESLQVDQKISATGNYGHNGDNIISISSKKRQKNKIFDDFVDTEKKYGVPVAAHDDLSKKDIIENYIAPLHTFNSHGQVFQVVLDLDSNNIVIVGKMPDNADYLSINGEAYKLSPMKNKNYICEGLNDIRFRDYLEELNNELNLKIILK